MLVWLSGDVLRVVWSEELVVAAVCGRVSERERGAGRRAQPVVPDVDCSIAGRPAVRTTAGMAWRHRRVVILGLAAPPSVRDGVCLLAQFPWRCKRLLLPGQSDTTAGVCAVGVATARAVTNRHRIYIHTAHCAACRLHVNLAAMNQWVLGRTNALIIRFHRRSSSLTNADAAPEWFKIRTSEAGEGGRVPQ